MTASDQPQVDQSSSFLDQMGIDAAFQFLGDNWPNQQMNPGQREAWLDILGQLRHGELKTALRGLPSRFRPDPYAVLEIVLQNRRPVLNDWRPKPYTKPSPETRERVAAITARARESLGPTKKAAPVPEVSVPEVQADLDEDF